MELAAKMAQDAFKSGFKEALEAPWEALGRPKREPRWANIKPKRGPRGTKVDASRVFV